MSQQYETQRKVYTINDASYRLGIPLEHLEETAAVIECTFVDNTTGWYAINKDGTFWSVVSSEDYLTNNVDAMEAWLFRHVKDFS